MILIIFAPMKPLIQTQNLDHLGIIAGIVDDLEIEHIVDSILPQNSREKISAGKIVKNIIKHKKINVEKTEK